MSERREQRAAEQLQRVGDRWTTTGKADAAWPVAQDGVLAPESAGVLDAAKPTYKHPARKSPWWRWT